MDIPINAKVLCEDGWCGQIVNIILKPISEVVTHIVVMDDSYPTTKHLVPIDQVIESAKDSVKLSCKCEALLKMPLFDDVQYILVTWGEFCGKPYMILPYFAPDGPYIRIEKEHIPATELVIRRGADVEASDGHIGRVNEFLIDPDNDRITHVVMHEGHLWGKRDISIPVGKIDHYKDNTVFLKLSKQEVENLPTIPIKHPSGSG